MDWSDRLGECCKPQLDALINAKRSGRLGHAFLIQSDSASVREDFALFLAQLGACAYPNPDGSACGKCVSCTQLANHTYAELHTLTPEGKMQEIKVGAMVHPEPNSVRGFCEKFYLTSLDDSARKVGIVYDADRMNQEAQNALLKTLEEPPPSSLIILATGKSGSLLPTTRSRCQTVTLSTAKLEYDFPGHEELGPILARLFFADGDWRIIADSADALVEMFSSLRSAADAEVEAEYAQPIADAAAMDERAAKQLRERAQAAADGRYLRVRGELVSAITAFFDQIYLLSSGAERSDLPNPELLSAVPPDALIATGRARRAADVVRTLQNSMRFTVNEALALRAAAFAIGQKTKPESL